MSNYMRRIEARLASLSQASELTMATKEWEFCGHVRDLGGADGNCELCEKSGVRYHFKISNAQTQHSLQVGSKCIERFELRVIDRNGKEVPASKKTSHLEGQKRGARVERILLILAELGMKVQSLKNLAQHYRKHSGFSPNQMVLAEWQLTKLDVSYALKDFTILLKRKDYQKQLKNMELWKLRKIWPALSGPQETIVRGWRKDGAWI